MNGKKKCLEVCILWPYPHCTFTNFLYLLVMVRTSSIPFPLASMVRMKCFTKVTSWLRGGRSWTDSVPSGPREGRRVKSPSFPFSVCTKDKIHLPKEARHTPFPNSDKILVLCLWTLLHIREINVYSPSKKREKGKKEIVLHYIFKHLLEKSYFLYTFIISISHILFFYSIQKVFKTSFQLHV